MDYITILRANLKKQKSSLASILVLMFIISIFLFTLLALWQNANVYVEKEMDRLGFGNITAWVSGVPDVEKLEDEIASLSEIERIEVQDIIFSNYSINGQISDSEGQLLEYNPVLYPYKIYTDDLLGYREEKLIIKPNEIYITPSMSSIYDIKLGDEIYVPIARQGVEKVFVVKGYFEDPFMGSSMIGMKSFLISEEDRNQILEIDTESGVNTLVRSGSMLHIFKDENSILSSSQLNSLLNQKTDLPSYVEFSHTSSAILGFMLILYNAFVGFLLVFVVVLIIISMVVIGQCISSAIDDDSKNMGILKTIGYTSKHLRRIQLLTYLVVNVMGMLAGLIGSFWLSKTIVRMTITTTGILIPTDLPIGLSMICFLSIIVLFSSFIYIKTNKIVHIKPLNAININIKDTTLKISLITPIYKKSLSFWMAARQLITDKKYYLSACIVTILLVFLMSLVVRLNSWLGTDGVGLMNAFNPADHDIGVQYIGEQNMEEIENIVLSYTDINDQYELAMQNVTVEGVDYTANIITEPERFHILKGRTCLNDNEVVITEFVASDLNISIGDSVTINSGEKSENYVVSGIYQCANDMGKNIGMSRDGFYKIGDNNKNIWCTHYFLDDVSNKSDILSTLQSIYGGDIHVHENSWPGLYSIINSMKYLTIIMYVIVIIFILVVVYLTVSKIFYKEQKDYGIYKSLGFSSTKLRFILALRFGIVSLVGSIIGMIISAVFTDSIVTYILKIAGISNFSSKLSLLQTLIPVIVVVSLFIVFAYIMSNKIKKIRVVNLV